MFSLAKMRLGSDLIPLCFSLDRGWCQVGGVSLLSQAPTRTRGNSLKCSRGGLNWILGKAAALRVDQASEQGAQVRGEDTISGGVQMMCECDTRGHGFW